MHRDIDTAVYGLRLLSLMDGESCETRVFEGQIILFRKLLKL